MRSGAFLALMVAPLGACDHELVLDNAKPELTWVQVESVSSEESALTLWIRDVEGDAVDASVLWHQGGASGPMQLQVGSAPLTGLQTQDPQDKAGRPSRVLWDLTEVPEGMVDVQFLLTDRPFEDSEPEVYWLREVDLRASSEPLAVAP